MNDQVSQCHLEHELSFVSALHDSLNIAYIVSGPDQNLEIRVLYRGGVSLRSSISS